MEKDNRRYLGIDIGSTTFKAVVMDEDGNVLHTTYQRTKPVDSGPVACSGRCTSCGRCNMGAVRKTVMTFLSDAGLKPEVYARLSELGADTFGTERPDALFAWLSSH